VKVETTSKNMALGIIPPVIKFMLQSRSIPRLKINQKSNWNNRRDLIHIDGRDKILELWAILFKSSPDFMFTLYETRAFYSHDWNPVITTGYEWHGTRVVDIRVVHNISSPNYRLYVAFKLVWCVNIVLQYSQYWAAPDKKVASMW
jgi:hypothetical protein